MQASALVARIAAAGGPVLEPVRPLAGGHVGAWEVRTLRGERAILTMASPMAGGPERVTALVDAARANGVPAPAYEAVVPLADGTAAIVQTLLPGEPPAAPTDSVIAALLESTEARRGLTDDRPTSLNLHADGPGYCFHGTLAADGRTRRLLRRVEETEGDLLRGTDVVHFDFHLGNVLVDPASGRLTGIVDWSGARSGHAGLDLVVLTFDAVRRDIRPAARRRIDRALDAWTDPSDRRRFWAHVSLRLVDFSLRTRPADVGDWLSVAEQEFPG